MCVRPAAIMRAVKTRTSARIADLSLYGASGFYFFGLLIGGALVGAALGWLVNNPGDGSAIGGVVGLACWLGLTITSFRKLRKYEGRRRQGPDIGNGDHRP
jgi:F0F1-type ATP synthase assembly protein I